MVNINPIYIIESADILEPENSDFEVMADMKKWDELHKGTDLKLAVDEFFTSLNNGVTIYDSTSDFIRLRIENDGPEIIPPPSIVLENLIKNINYLISVTPTGDIRNHLTSAHILLLAARNEQGEGGF